MSQRSEGMAALGDTTQGDRTDNGYDVELMELLTERGVVENNPIMRSGVAREADRNDAEEMPETGLAKNLLSMFKGLETQAITVKQTAHRPSGVGAKPTVTPLRPPPVCTPQESVLANKQQPSTAVQNEQVANEIAKESSNLNDEELPPSGITKNLVSVFKQRHTSDKASATPRGLSAAASAASLSRTGSSSSIGDGSRSALAEASAPLQEAYCPADAFTDQELPPTGITKKLATAFKQCEEGITPAVFFLASPESSSRKTSLSSFSEDMAPGLGVAENIPVILEGVARESDRNDDEELPMPGTARMMMEQLKRQQELSKITTHKEHTPSGVAKKHWKRGQLKEAASSSNESENNLTEKTDESMQAASNLAERRRMEAEHALAETSHDFVQVTALPTESRKRETQTKSVNKSMESFHGINRLMESIRGKAESIEGEAESIGGEAETIEGEAEITKGKAESTEAESIKGESESIKGEAESIGREAEITKGKAESTVAESIKGEAEITKGKAESIQGEAESIKGEAEITKGKAESIQGEAESIKGEAEITKGKAEITKGEAESIKGEVESIKGEAEITKREAEITKGKAESTKGEAEITKREAEITKGKAESTEAESIKGESESIKGEAEITKGKAESIKREAESIKREAESTKGEAETIKGEAEKELETKSLESLQGANILAERGFAEMVNKTNHFSKNTKSVPIKSDTVGTLKDNLLSLPSPPSNEPVSKDIKSQSALTEKQRDKENSLKVNMTNSTPSEPVLVTPAEHKIESSQTETCNNSVSQILVTKSEDLCFKTSNVEIADVRTKFEKQLPESPASHSSTRASQTNGPSQITMKREEGTPPVPSIRSPSRGNNSSGTAGLAAHQAKTRFRELEQKESEVATRTHVPSKVASTSLKGVRWQKH